MGGVEGRRALLFLALKVALGADAAVALADGLVEAHADPPPRRQARHLPREAQAAVRVMRSGRAQSHEKNGIRARANRADAGWRRPPFPRT